VHPVRRRPGALQGYEVTERRLAADSPPRDAMDEVVEIARKPRRGRRFDGGEET
jgi:hypothetical protein